MSEQAKRESEREMGCGGGGSVMREWCGKCDGHLAAANRVNHVRPIRMLAAAALIVASAALARHLLDDLNRHLTNDLHRHLDLDLLLHLDLRESIPRQQQAR